MVALGGSGKRLPAASRRARAESRRGPAARASGCRCQALSKACLRDATGGGALLCWPNEGPAWNALTAINASAAHIGARAGYCCIDSSSCFCSRSSKEQLLQVAKPGGNRLQSRGRACAQRITNVTLAGQLSEGEERGSEETVWRRFRHRCAEPQGERLAFGRQRGTRYTMVDECDMRKAEPTV
jgi:hypothetical protein